MGNILIAGLLLQDMLLIKHPMSLRFLYRSLLTAVSISLITAISCSEKIHPAAVNYLETGVALSDINRDILLHVNEYRKTKGLAALQMNTVISVAAEGHSKAMADKKIPFGHDGFESRVKAIREQLGLIRSSAENVAYGNITAREVVNGWIKSPGHRKNIEGSFSLTGIGLSRNKTGTIYFTQIFAAK